MLLSYILILLNFLFLVPRDKDLDKLIKSMTLNEKIGQLFIVPIQADYLNENNDEYEQAINAIKKYNVGGFILFAGSVYSVAIQVNDLQKLSKYPLFIASDYERGITQQLPNGIAFPPNMAMAATYNAEYSYWQGKITAQEARAIGVNFVFAPVLDINNNAKNPIINFRSYGDNPQLVAKFGTAMLKGLEENGVLATAKHFPGHGDTSSDSHNGLPILDFSLNRLDSLEFFPFRAAVNAGISAIMIAHIALPQLNGDERPACMSPFLLDTILRQKWGYKGLIITDAFNMKGISPNGLNSNTVVKAIKAGVDIILMPLNISFAVQSVLDAIKNKELTIKDIDTHLERILSAKKKLGLFKTRLTDITKIKSVVENNLNKIKAETIAKQSITWLQRNSLVLPLEQGKKITVISTTSEAALENPGKLFFNRLKSFYSSAERVIIDLRFDSVTIPAVKRRIDESDLVIIALFSRTRGGKETVGIDAREQRYIREILKYNKKEVLVISFGSPYMNEDFPEFGNHLTAFSYSEMMQDACARAIGGAYKVRGVLPIKLASFTSSKQALIDSTRPNFDFTKLDLLIKKSISDSVFPGTSIIVGSHSEIYYQKAYGRFTYSNNSTQVTEETLYDIASLTKIYATTLAIMKLIDQNFISLNSTLGDLLSETDGTKKENITIGQLLTHTSGMLWHKNFFETTKSKVQMYKLVLQEPLRANPGDTTMYSDLGLITLMSVIERVTGLTLDNYVQKNFYRDIELTGIKYKPNEEEKKLIPPTEAVAWRGHLAQGEVHDENAMAMGGVSSHAGLFANTRSLAALSQLFLNRGEYQGKRYVSAKLVDLFGKRANLDTASVRGYGWDKPKAISMAGKYVADEAYMHTGFTGTSVIIDPKNDVFIILLSNRVYPSRKNAKMGDFRQIFHDTVMEILGKTTLRESYKKVKGIK